MLPGRWNYDALTGRLTELSALGASVLLTLAFAIVHAAQHQGEPAAWITRSTSLFFPPDAVASGIDLEALVVVRVPDGHAAARAAEMLARSGAFGLLVLDLQRGASIPLPLQARLLGLAQRYDTAVLCLTEKRRSVP